MHGRKNDVNSDICPQGDACPSRLAEYSPRDSCHFMTAFCQSQKSSLCWKNSDKGEIMRPDPKTYRKVVGFCLFVCLFPFHLVNGVLMFLGFY